MMVKLGWLWFDTADAVGGSVSDDDGGGGIRDGDSGNGHNDDDNAISLFTGK